MKQSSNHHDEENKLIDTIRRMSSQINISDGQSMSMEHSKFLAEVIEHLEDQLESLRKNHQVSRTA